MTMSAIAFDERQPGQSDAATGVADTRAKMHVLSALVGDFDLRASETATDESSFTETGIRTCRWALGETAVVCEDARTLREATGRYRQLPSNRRFLRLFRWNSEASTFEQLDLGPSRVPQVRALAFDSGRVAWSYTSVVHSQSVGQTLDAVSTLTLSGTGHDVVQILRSRSSAFSEEYRESATRR